MCSCSCPSSTPHAQVFTSRVITRSPAKMCVVQGMHGSKLRIVRRMEVIMKSAGALQISHTPPRTFGGRPADRGEDQRGGHRFFDLFLGPSHTRLPRYRRSGPHADGRAVEHPRSLQQSFGGLHDHLSTDGRRVSTAPYRRDRHLRKPLTASLSYSGVRSV